MRSPGMSNWIPILTVTLTLSAATASAEGAEIVLETPAEAVQPRMTYAEFRLKELEQGVRRSGIALGATTGAAVLGTALLFPGLIRQCWLVQVPGDSDQVQCSRAGKALVGVGYPLFLGGILGMITTGIMYGVRKGKVRKLKRDIAYQKSRAVQWDPAASVFRF